MSYVMSRAIRAAAAGNRGRQAPRPAKRPGAPLSFTEAMDPAKRRAFMAANFGTGQARPSAAVAVPEPETVATTPQAQPPVIARREVDGAEVLENTRKFLRRYAVWPSESALTAATLWVAGSHARNASGMLVWREFPRLGMLSSEPGSGKSRVLELLQMLCPAAPSIEGEPSEAAVALMIGKEHRTLLLDEADVLFGAGNRKAAIRAIINAGYKRGGTWSRVRKGAVESVPVFGALALAGLDVMEKGTGSSLEALLQRFIIIRMRKAEGNPPRKPREILGKDPRTGRNLTGEDAARRIAELLEIWTAQELPVLAKLTPQMPPGVELRQEELWIALLAIAEQAGGHWQETAWEACTDMSLYGGTPDVIGENIDMLADLTAGWD